MTDGLQESNTPRSHRLVIRCLLLAGLVAPAHGAPVQESPHAHSADARTEALDVEFLGDRLYVNAHGAPLRQVLQEIVARTELLVVARSSLDRPVTLMLDGVSLSEGLRRMLRHEAFALYETSTTKSAERGRLERKRTLWIYPAYSAAGADTETITLRGTRDATLLAEKLLDENARVRREAVKALRRIDPDLSLTALAQALGDPDEQIRVKAIYGLAAIGGEQAAGALTSALSDPDPWVREEAAYALGVTGSETARQALRGALSDTHAGVREMAIDAYAELGGEEAANALGMALADTEPYIRVEAVEALRDLGGEPATRVLGNAVNDADEEVRKAAIDALGELRNERATLALADALDDGNPEIRKRAVEALGGSHNRMAWDLLARVAANDPDTSVAEVAATFLAAQRTHQ